MTRYKNTCFAGTKVQIMTPEELQVCNTTSIDIFSTAYSQPVYYCPQNTYASGPGCQSCAAEKTSATASTSIDQCVTCRPEYDKEKQSWIYSYLNCDGKGCGLCPPGTIRYKNTGFASTNVQILTPEELSATRVRSG
jgi:hypothetical protein